MGLKGYEFADRTEAMSYSSDRLLEFSNLLRVRPDGGRSLSPELMDRLQKLADDEIALAVADSECSRPFEKALQTAVAEFQAEFLSEHG